MTRPLVDTPRCNIGYGIVRTSSSQGSSAGPLARQPWLSASALGSQRRISALDSRLSASALSSALDSRLSASVLGLSSHRSQLCSQLSASALSLSSQPQLSAQLSTPLSPSLNSVRALARTQSRSSTLAPTGTPLVFRYRKSVLKKSRGLDNIMIPGLNNKRGYRRPNRIGGDTPPRGESYRGSGNREQC